MRLATRKAQSSIEFLSVFGLAMLMAAPFIVAAQSSIVQLQTGADSATLQNSMDKLESAVTTVEASGPPAKRTFAMDIPGNVEESYVVNNRAVVFTVNTPSGRTNVSRIFDTQIAASGGLPSSQGVYPMSVTAWQDQVNITRHNSNNLPKANNPPKDDGEETQPLAQGVFFVENGDMKFLNTQNDSVITVYEQSSVEVIGPQNPDFDSDDQYEVPFVTSSARLKLVDSNGEVVTLAENARDFKSKIGINKTAEVTKALYPGDSNNNYEIYSADTSSDPQEISDPGDGVGAVSGWSDFDDDQEKEIIFIDGSSVLQYVDQDGTVVDTGVQVGSNNGVGVGTPWDFNKDEVPRVPIVDGNNNIALVSSSGDQEVLTSSSPARKTSISVLDVDDDSEKEILFVSKDDGVLKYLQVSEKTISTINPEVKPDTSVGISSRLQ